MRTHAEIREMVKFHRRQMQPYLDRLSYLYNIAPRSLRFYTDGRPLEFIYEKSEEMEFIEKYIKDCTEDFNKKLKNEFNYDKGRED